ncbi:MAG TPA: DUF4157 domain-containing protein [Thermoanaerobaculia bacterium]|nr:DUF4157 domain-containing protein [Thermoanaerobaculia bacterium]
MISRVPTPRAKIGPPAAVRQVLHGIKPQPKLTVGAPNDAFEREADHVADQVMRMPEAEIAPAAAPMQVQRLCSECEEEEMRAKEEPGETPEMPSGFARRFAALHNGGQPLPAAERSFFEPRFGRDFADVRLHSGPAAGELARSVHARAFTLGDSIVLGSGQYAPGTSAGRQLLAHELTHVMQQGGGGGGQVVRRQTMHASCSDKEAVVLAAWAEGQRMTEATIAALEAGLNWAKSEPQAGGAIPSFVAKPLENAFGAMGLDALAQLIKRYEQILGGFKSGKTLRCDPTSIAGDHGECDTFGAFVLKGNSTDIFLCPSFFWPEPEQTATSRGVILLHEMAHSILGIGHEGGVKVNLSCDTPYGLAYEVAKLNAHPYGILAQCLAGRGAVQEGEEIVAPQAGELAGGRTGSRWSISAAAGADVTPKAQRFAAALSGRLSLSNGDLVAWGPAIGLLHLRSSSANPSDLFAATAELGLRVGRPLKGFYFDVSAGSFGGIDIDPRRETPRQLTGGFTGAVGMGLRSKRWEAGVETRALVPDVDLGRTEVMIFGRVALRFGSSR